MGTAVHLGRSAARSVAPAWRHRRAFADLEAYCTFVGYPRSGHTLVGALLDAHPDAVIAHELDALRLVRWRVPRPVLLGLLVRRSEEFARDGARWMGYDYAVPGEWQGRYETLRVIGDKRGATSSARLGRRPELVERLRATVRLPLRFVRVMRNPYDNVARMYLVGRERGDTLETVVDRYASLVSSGARVEAAVGEAEWLDVRSEALIVDPRATLTGLCAFVGLEPLGGWLDAAASVVFETPNRTRERIDWPPWAVERVAGIIASTPHLAGYTFET